MTYFEFLEDYSSWIVKRLQCMDYQFSLINALENDDKDILELLAKYTTSSDLKSGFFPNLKGTLTVGKGLFRKETIVTLKAITYVEMFSVLESTLQHILMAADLEYKERKIDTASFEEHHVFSKPFSQLLSDLKEFSEVKHVDNSGKRLSFQSSDKLFNEMSLAQDIRNCLMHSLGRVTKNRKIIKKHLGYTDTEYINEKHINPAEIKALIITLISNWKVVN